MAKPTKPTAPDPALRSDPDTFSARLEDNILFWPTHLTYLDAGLDYMDTGLTDVVATALAGDLPALTGEAGKFVRVNAGETAAEFTADVAPLAGPTFTGVPTAPTAAVDTDTTQIATTAYVMARKTAPTAAAATNTTQIATTAYTRTAIPDVLNATGAAPMYACRAWVNFNGNGTVAIRASGNVSSITDNGAGDYTVNFATAMQDSSYCCQVTAGNADTPGSYSAVGWSAVYAVGSVRIGVSDNNTDTKLDQENVNVSIFR